MLAWILEDAGLSPGFLVGGVPVNFGVSARLSGSSTDSPFFVIEADEYDTAFCDKRSKFVHYRPRTASSTISSSTMPTYSPIWQRSKHNSTISYALCRAMADRVERRGSQPGTSSGHGAAGHRSSASTSRWLAG
jgi:hypothetical protein